MLHDGGAAELEHRGRRIELEMDELAAEPDPLAATEAELLIHLADAHGNAIELLAQLVDRRSLLGVTRVDPLRPDRCGIVLRLRRARGYHDVRLFSTPPQNPAHGMLQMRALPRRRPLHAAHGADGATSRRNGPRSPPPRERTW